MRALTTLALVASAVLAAALLPSAAEASASSQADTMRTMVPRYGGKDEFDPEDKDYQMMAAALAAVPLALAVLTLLVAFFFCLCRCCSCIGLCHCCVSRPREEGYSKRARWVPWLFLALFGGLVFAMATYGITENEKLSDTLTAEQASGKSSVVNFLPRVFEGTRGKITDLRGPLLDILDRLDPTVDQVSTVLERSVGTIENGTTGLTDEMRAFNSTWSGYTVVTPLQTFVCQYCTTVGGTIGNMSVEIDDQTGDMVADMRDTISNVKTTLTEEVDNIRTKVADVNTTMADADDNVDDGEDVADDIIKALKDYDPLRKQATFYLYLFPLAGLALVLIGTLFKVGCLFRVNVWMFFLSTFVFWVLLAVYLPVAVVLGDACVYVDQEEAKLPEKTEDFAKVAQACLVNTSVIDALDAREELNFTDAINFPELPNVTEAFQFESLDQLETQVNNLTLDTFGWNESVITEPIAQFNASYPPGRPQSDFESGDADTLYGPGGSAEKTAFVNTQEAVQNGTASKAILEQTIVDMQTDVASMVNTTNTLEVRIGAAVDDIDALELLLTPFLEIVDLLISRATCAFLGDLYRELNDLTCKHVSTHMAVLGMTCFFIAFAGWWIIVMSQISASRIPRPYKDDWDDDAKKESRASEVEMRQIHVKSRDSKDMENGTTYKH